MSLMGFNRVRREQQKIREQKAEMLEAKKVVVEETPKVAVKEKTEPEFTEPVEKPKTRTKHK